MLRSHHNGSCIDNANNLPWCGAAWAVAATSEFAKKAAAPTPNIAHCSYRTTMVTHGRNAFDQRIAWNGHFVWHWARSAWATAKLAKSIGAPAMNRASHFDAGVKTASCYTLDRRR